MKCLGVNDEPLKNSKGLLGIRSILHPIVYPVVVWTEKPNTLLMLGREASSCRSYWFFAGSYSK